jgi:sugar phosphate isomerase/epimerase
MPTTRRHFLQTLTTLSAGFALAPNSFSNMNFKPQFEISLAEWSFHKALQSGKMNNLEFPVIAKKQFDIHIVEYVNQFFKDKATDRKYLAELLQRCKDNGVKNHLIMIDGEGDMGSTKNAERLKAVENHYKWVDAAKFLGCITIRVNAHGEGTAEDVQSAAVDGIGQLAEYASKAGINIIIENHGGMSSNGDWLLALVKRVNKKNVGILPDFGNFCIRRDSGQLYSGKCIEEYDKYKAVKMWMPYAKGVSAKTINIDSSGNCQETDYNRMMKIIKDANFSGYVGIEYEGDTLTEEEGVKATKLLLQKVSKDIGYGIKA